MRGIRYFLGATLGAVLVFFLISFIFLRPRDVNESEILEFIKRSDKTLVTAVPYVGGILSNDDERLGGRTISKTTYFSNRNMSYLRGDSYLYFSKELNKYIKTYYLSIKGNNLFSSMMKFGKKNKDKNIYPDMYFYYNKAQNIDPSYGTIDKPLPILMNVLIEKLQNFSFSLKNVILPNKTFENRIIKVSAHEQAI